MKSKEALHEIIQDLFKVRSELGRFPSRSEYLHLGKFKNNDIAQSFGGWTQLLQAGGVHYSKGKRDKQEIRKEAFEHLKKEVEARRKIEPPPVFDKLLCISDMHHPYGHPDIVPFLAALKSKYQFDGVLVGGDEVDHHALSFHDSDPDLLSAGHELEAAIECLKPIYKLFPKAMVLSSNHGDLVYRKGKHHGIPRHVLKGYGEVLQAPKDWVWKEEHSFQFSNGRKCFAMHGISKNGILCAQKRGESFIQFHYHNELSIKYTAHPTVGEVFFIQSGCLIDDKSLAFAYNKAIFDRPVIGCSGVLSGLPRLFPMLLDKFNRWTGFVP